MKPDDKQAPSETGLTVWRRSYAQLRLLERELVSASRAGDDPARLEGLFQQIEALRLATTELFTAAQLESVSRHVQLFRTSSSARRDQQQEFLLLTEEPAAEEPEAAVPPPPRSQAPEKQKLSRASATATRSLAVRRATARHAP